jgi:tetratricopeptide (TPR) repeat protein
VHALDELFLAGLGFPVERVQVHGLDRTPRAVDPRFVKWIAITLIAGAAGTNAYADSDEAAQEFEKGRKLKEMDELDAACAHFQRSYELEPAAGTALNVAECYEREGRWEWALDFYEGAAKYFEKNKRGESAKFARERAEAIRAAHPKPQPAPVVDEKPPQPPPDRTGLKTAIGVSYGITVIAGAWWFFEYRKIEAYDGGVLADFSGESATEADCGSEVLFAIDDSDLAKFNRACTAYGRTKFLIPTTLIAGAVGTGLLVYYFVTKPKAVVVVPHVSTGAASVTAGFEW